jgi:hypothetical protein
VDTLSWRISHHLLFVSKNFRGYPLMKEIMAPESSSAPQGVPSFEYNPRDYSMLPSFELYQPPDELEKRLLADLGGRTLTMNQIYERPQRQQAVHQEKTTSKPCRPCTRVGLSRRSREPKPGTFADRISVSFPADAT